MIKKRLLLSLCIAIAILFSNINIRSYAADLDKNEKYLSTMTDEESLMFLKDNNIEIPSELVGKNDLIPFIKSIIINTERNPNFPIYVNYHVTRNFAESLKSAVINYYEINSKISRTASIASSYTLQDSTVLGAWYDSYLNYNCYGHAINQTSNFVDPGYYSNSSFSINDSITTIANLVVKDLNSLGYWARTTSSRPTFSSLASYEKAICVRKGSLDYHFMKLNSGEFWSHKPGQTAVLRYIYSNPGYKFWSNEFSYKGVSYAPTLTYDSSVIYIIYWPKGTGPEPTSNNN